MEARETGEAVDVIEENAVETGPGTMDRLTPANEPSNPDAWLQWALVIGLLALFLICAVLILIAWNES